MGIGQPRSIGFMQIEKTARISEDMAILGEMMPVSEQELVARSIHLARELVEDSRNGSEVVIRAPRKRFWISRKCERIRFTDF